jgi:micrococcal nuclease
MMLPLLAVAVWAQLPQPFEAAVARTVDGDTFVVERPGSIEQTVRLWGADSPEPGQPYFDEAHKRLKELLSGAKPQIVPRERQGRILLASVSVPGKEPGERLDVARTLVFEGLAWWEREQAKEDEVLPRHEAEAREAKRNLWSRPDAVAPWDWRAGRRTPPAPPAEAPDPTVYVTPSGNRYHRPTCQFVRTNRSALKLSEARKRFTPCSVCKPLQ